MAVAKLAALVEAGQDAAAPGGVRPEGAAVRLCHAKGVVGFERVRLSRGLRRPSF